MMSFDYFVVGFMVAICMFFARNNMVYRVRTYMLWHQHDGYERLPSYERMVLHPNYWLLWTLPHWQAWLVRHGMTNLTEGE